MIDALYNGISGLNSSQNGLNTASNNISNVNTVAYKSDIISFADMMYQSKIGKGVSVETVNKSFTQGSLKNTGAPYDMAINGKGFFLVQGESATVEYTRAGNFKIAADGTLQMQNGYNVLGTNASNRVINASDPLADKFTDEYSNFVASDIIKSENDTIIENINVKVTDFYKTAKNDDMLQSGNNYKTVISKTQDVEKLMSTYRNELNLYSTAPQAGVLATAQSTNITYDPTHLLNENSSVEIVIGNTKIQQNFTRNSQETLNAFTDKISKITGLEARVDNAGKLNIKSMIPGEKVTITDAKILNNSAGNFREEALNINTTEAISGSGRLKLEAIENALKSTVENAGGKFMKLSVSIDTTQEKVDDIQLRLDTLNLSSSAFGTPEIKDGILYMTQGNSVFAIAKIQTALFVNESGLKAMGDNIFANTRESGEAIRATNENKILDNTLELSNSDIGTSLVDLMVLQRSFEASSKSITTSDEFLKTAIALKK
jgi:flagellar hook protein FlgE